ncbi:MAG: diguanylate cyclase [Rhodospirillales bacterium]|nr:diguanylate cyclase [Rhodospirillales bacterium]
MSQHPKTANESRDHWRLIRFALFLCCIIGTIGTGWRMSTVIAHGTEGLARYNRVDVWAVQQLEYELQRLQSLFASHVAGDTDTSITNVRKQLSRAVAASSQLLHGPDRQLFQAMVDLAGTEARVRSALEKSGDILIDRDNLVNDLEALKAMDQTLTPALHAVRKLAADVASVRMSLQDGDLKNIHWLVSVNRWLLIGCSVTAFVFAFLILRETRTAWRAERVARDNEERSRYLAYHDTLTGLSNRRALQEELRLRLSQPVTAGRCIVLMLLDLDRFKEINDTFGHPFGDRLLVDVTLRLLPGLGEGDVLARLSGDEFAIVTTSSEDGAEVDANSARVLSSFQQPFVIDDHTVNVSCSLGMACFPVDCETEEDLFRAADLALQAAKCVTENHAARFEKPMLTRLAERKSLEGELRLAIERQEGLEVFFQPQMHLATGRWIGAEALLRWKHAELGWISPGTLSRSPRKQA